MYRVRQVSARPKSATWPQPSTVNWNVWGGRASSRKGIRIAVTAGSRGIRDIVPLLRQIVEFVREHGAEPFSFPGYGQSWRGSAEGHIQVPESLGISEASIGAPVRASMEVKQVGLSRYGYSGPAGSPRRLADGMVVVNRIKPHTEFEGPVESGLTKIWPSAWANTRAGSEVAQADGNSSITGLPRRDTGNRAGAPGQPPGCFRCRIVENVYDQTALVRAVPPSSASKSSRPNCWPRPSGSWRGCLRPAGRPDRWTRWART